MQIIRTSSENQETVLNQAISVLRSGGIVIYPTETTYGVAIDVENPEAVEKLLAYKSKRDGKPISVAVADSEMAKRYVILNETANQVYKTFLPGPVTVVSTGTGMTAPGIASSEGKVGIRIPKYDLALDLIRAFGSGISATGANASNQKRPYAIQDILDNISQKQKDLIDLIIDVGELPHNEPSTVIDTTIDDIVVLRQGPLQFQDSKQVITHTEAETIAWFEQFSRSFKSYFTYTPILFLFSGEMGAGKTHAIKGLGKGLGISQMITSPTYTFANEYPFISEGQDGIFVHIDCWRMKSFSELTDLGLENSIKKNAVIAIEWSERFSEEFEMLKEKAKIVHIHLESGKDANDRTIIYHL